jgi:hypothetical protein
MHANGIHLAIRSEMGHSLLKMVPCLFDISLAFAHILVMVAHLVGHSIDGHYGFPVVGAGFETEEIGCPDIVMVLYLGDATRIIRQFIYVVSYNDKPGRTIGWRSQHIVTEGAERISRVLKSLQQSIVFGERKIHKTKCFP